MSERLKGDSADDRQGQARVASAAGSAWLHQLLLPSSYGSASSNRCHTLPFELTRGSRTR